MYRLEIFNENMDFVSACYTDDAQTIAIDYLAYDPFQITCQNIEAKKGYFAHITAESEVVADCIVADVQPDKNQQELSLRPLQALFDFNVFYSAVTDAISWLDTTLTEQFVTNADVLQRRPLSITSTAGSRNFPLTGYNLNPTMNILSVITNAFSTWGVVTEAHLDLTNKQIVVNIYEQTAEQTIECDLDNIISSEITLGDSYGSTNKLTIKKTVQDGTPSGVTEVTYYRHTDGSIDTVDDDRVVPVFWDVTTIEQTSDMTDSQWLAETVTKAREVLSVGKYDNEVILSVWVDDRIINPRDIEIGTITTLLLKGETYYSILTGYTIEGSIMTLTFGAVRTELTKKLSIQNRSSGSSSASSSGGGGGGGGTSGVTGVKGDAESTYRIGDVNLTPADLGAVPDTRTVNGHALSSNVTVTATDVGLGNVNNTSDLNKPISTATQTALDDKVSYSDIATTSDLGIVMPDGTTITVDQDGTIHAAGGGGGSDILYFYQRAVSVGSNAEILRITDASITTDTVVLECTFANPTISGDVVWTSYNGYISFVGTCTSATTANVTLADKSN